MANVNFDINNDDSMFDRRYQSSDQDRKFPKPFCSLIHQLFIYDEKQILEILITYDTEQKIIEFKSDLQSLEIRPEIRGEKQMRLDFYQKLSQTITQCFNYVHVDGISTENQKQRKFIIFFQLLVHEVGDLHFSEEFCNQFWQQLIKIKDFQQLHKYLSLFYECFKHKETQKKSLKNKSSGLQQKIKKQYLLALHEYINKQPEQEKDNAQKPILPIIIAKFSKQQKLILHLQMCRLLKQLENESYSEISQKIQKQIWDYFTKTQSNNGQTFLSLLLNYVGQFHNLSSLYHQILSCEINSTKLLKEEQACFYSNKSTKIHQSFLTYQNIAACMKNKKRNKVKYLDKLSVVVAQNMILCKFDLEIIQFLDKQIISKDCHHSETVLFDLHYIVSLLLDNLDKQITIVGKNKMDIKGINAFQYMVRVFQLLNRYLLLVFRSESTTEIQNCYEQQFTHKLLGQIQKWAIDPQLRLNTFFKEVYGDLISFVAYYLHIFQQGDFQFRSYLIKSCVSIILSLGYLPSQWRVFKHTRLIIELWAMQENIEAAKIQSIVNIFIEGFFTENFIFTKDSYFIFLKQKIPSLNYRQTFSKTMLNKISDLFKNLLGEQSTELTKEMSLKYNRYIFTIHLILSGNFKITTGGDIANILNTVYLKYAHKLTSIYSLRTWITEEYKPCQSDLLVKKINKNAQGLNNLEFLSNNSLSALQSLQNQFPEHITKQQRSNFQQYVIQSQLLINQLELKNQLQVLSQQAYGILIHDIINKLSDSVGEIYNKILDMMMKSKEDNAHIEKLLIRNFFLKKKSIYCQVHEIMFSLKNIIRLYICNLTILTSFTETRHICTQIGKLFENLHQRSHRQQRTRIQLINQFLSNYIFKKKSHLLDRQTLYYSNAYSIGRKQNRQTLGRSSFLSLNIVIPIFAVLRQTMPQFIKLLTSYGREQFQGRFRFNHHIAFENQLRKILPNSDIFDVVINNTLITHATSLINSIFLPKINNRTEELEQVGLSLYIEQFEQIFKAEECQDYTQDHIATFIQIYKHKNRGDISRSQLEDRTLFKGIQPHDFTEYGIKPISYEEFKEKARSILLQFLKKLPNKIFGMNARKFSLTSILSIIKEFNTIEGDKMNVNSQSQLFTQSQFLKTLIEKSKAVIEENIRQRKIMLQKKTDIQSPKKQDCQPNANQKKQVKKKQGIEYSQLFMVFKVLCHVGATNEDLVRQTYKLQIHNCIIEILNLTTNSAEISQCFTFIFETLPKFHSQLQQKQVLCLYQFYLKILSLLDQFKQKPVYEINKLFNKFIQNICPLKTLNTACFETISSKIIHILLNSLKADKPIPNIDSVLIKFISLEGHQSFWKSYLQMEIKYYIYQQYFTQLQEYSKGKTSIAEKYLNDQNCIAIDIKEYLKSFEWHIIIDPEIFKAVTLHVFSCWTPDGHYLLYKQGLPALYFSGITKFVNWENKFDQTHSGTHFYQTKISRNTLILMDSIINKIFALHHEEQIFKQKIQTVQKQLAELKLKQKQQLKQKQELNKKDQKVSNNEQTPSQELQVDIQITVKDQQAKNLIFPSNSNNVGEIQKKENKGTQEDSQQTIINKKLKTLNSQKNKCTKNKNRLLKTLLALLSQFKILLPSIITKKYSHNKQSIDFLDWLIENAFETLEFKYIDFIMFCLNRNFLYVKGGKMFCSYIAARIITKSLKLIKQNSEKEKNVVFVLLCSLLLKDFNSLSSLPIFQKGQKVTLAQEIKHKIVTYNKQNNSTQMDEDPKQKISPPIQLLYGQAFYLISRHCLTNNFFKSNRLFEENLPGQRQYINPKLFFIDHDSLFSSNGKRRMRYARSQKQVIQKYKESLNISHYFDPITQLQANSLQQIMNQFQKQFVDANSQTLISDKQCIKEEIEKLSQIKYQKKQNNPDSVVIFGEIYKNIPDSQIKQRKNKKSRGLRYSYRRSQDSESVIIQSLELTNHQEIFSYCRQLKNIVVPPKGIKKSRRMFWKKRLSSEQDDISDQSNGSADQDNHHQRNRIQQPLRYTLLEQIESESNRRRDSPFRFRDEEDQAVISPIQFVENLENLTKKTVTSIMNNSIDAVNKLEQKKYIKEQKQEKRQESQILEKKQKRKQQGSQDEQIQKQQPRLNISKILSHKSTSQEPPTLIKSLSQTKRSIQQQFLVKVEEQNESDNTQKINRLLQKFSISEKMLEEENITKEQLSKMKEDEISDILQGIIDGKIREDKQKLQYYQNTNYRVLQSKKNFYDRCQFLIDAPESFFTDLPLEIRADIIRQRDILKRDNVRSNRFKQIQNMMLNNEEPSDRISFYSTGNRVRRSMANKKTTLKKFKKISVQDELLLSQEVIMSIFNQFLIRVKNVSENYNNSLSLLLQTQTNQISHKTLTTLIYMLKNPSAFKIICYNYDEDKNNIKQWKKQILVNNAQNSDKQDAENSQKKKRKDKNSEELKIFKEEILKRIFYAIEGCRFQNKQLIGSRISYDSYIQKLTNIKQVQVQQSFKKELGADQTSYNPSNELFDIILDENIYMAPDFITKMKQIPSKMVEKIFQKTFKSQIPLEFYDKAEILSDNIELAKLFQNRYSEQKPPSFQLLGKIMKYKFGQLPYLKALHEKALKYYVSSHNDFLRQIFRYYTCQQLQLQMENFIKYRQIHFKLIQELFEQGTPIQNQPIHKLISIPDLLDFPTKKMIFLRHPKFQTSESSFNQFSDQSMISIDIDNKDILRSSYNSIMSLVATQMRKRISVKFIGQSAFGEGIFKVWINQVAKQIFNPSACLFVPVGQQDTYQPNPYSYQNPEHLNYLKFLGRLLGLAILQNQVVPAFFTKIFYKMLLNITPHYSDLKDVNYDLYETIKFIKNSQGEGDIGEVGYTFVYKGLDVQGQKVEKQLKPGGKDIIVTQQNKEQFISLATKEVLTDFCSDQYDKIKEGFNDIIPLETLSIFSINDLELLISGVPQISIEQFKKYTKYSHYDQNDQVIQWFWEVVNESSKEEVTNIIQFITGTSRLTEGGFAKNPITIRKSSGADQWPRGVTCFNSLQLPQYKSKQILKDRLTKVLIWSKGGIGLEQ